MCGPPLDCEKCLKLCKTLLHVHLAIPYEYPSIHCCAGRDGNPAVAILYHGGRGVIARNLGHNMKKYCACLTGPGKSVAPW